MSSESWKLEKDLCRCCHSEGNFKNLAEPAQSTGLAEFYADMLNECFDIDMVPVPGLLSATTYTICEVCIIRLRDASDFKRQVLSCEERFKDLYSRNRITATTINVEVKQELPDSDAGPDEDFKVEITVDDIHHADHTETFDIQISEEEEEEESAAVEFTKKRKYTPRKNVKCKTTKKTERKNAKEDSADDENDAEKKQDEFKVELELDDSDGDRQISDEEEEEEFAPVEVTKKRKCTPKKKVKCKTTKKRVRKAKKDPADDENDAEKKQGRVVAPKFRLNEDDYKKVGDTYHCARCDKTYDKLTTLKFHLKTKHYKIPRYKCSICMKDFMTPAPLTVHKLEVHNVDDRFNCKACNKNFNTKVQLRKHINNFHMLGERYKCEFCDYESFSFEGMYKHKFKHKTVKDYHCKFCRKSFLRKTTLDLHERIHTGDRRKICMVCGQAFVQKASLNYHMTKYHPEVYF